MNVNIRNTGQMAGFQIGDENTMTVANAINQLPSSSEPDKPGIKELLEQLKTAIESEASLDEEEKDAALMHLEQLAIKGKDPQAKGVKLFAENSILALKGIVSVGTLADLATKALPILKSIAGVFGVHLP